MRIEAADLPPVTKDFSGSDYHRAKTDRKTYLTEYDKKRSRTRVKDTSGYRMIAWDGEGMKLSGEKFPQHYVLFGCSADVENPLIIDTTAGKLKFPDLVDYAVSIKERFPDAYHVGYYFRYDQNMIIQSLSGMQKLRLYEKGSVSQLVGEWRYGIKWIPGKKIWLSKRRKDEKGVTILIEDMAAFFATSFVSAYESLCGSVETNEALNIVKAGKANRASMLYADLPMVLRYWQKEIVTLEELATTFRDIMYEADFRLKSWYGPGALANYLRKKYGLDSHEWGGKEENMPHPVHEASKRAYFGGRFEQFKAGRIKGPIYYYDVNSAYPAAIRMFPSMEEGGIWRAVNRRTAGVRLGVYRVRFHTPLNNAASAMPLPHRDDRHSTTFPPGVSDGWYWTPEIVALAKWYNDSHTVIEGWEWWPADPEIRPWRFIEDVYQQRLDLKRKGSPVQMAYKLAMNSLYGKFAQRVGWDEENFTPPKAHTLPLAGWITSSCRATILSLVTQIPADELIAIETDGVICTTPPERLNIPMSDKLGEWGVNEPWDEMIMIQSGLYLFRVNGEWQKPKTRGIDAGSITYPLVHNYMSTLMPGEPWDPIEVPQGERFIGLGAALNRSRTRNGTGPINPFKLEQIHCRWEKQPREIAPGKHGKRVHAPAACSACSAGHSPATMAHTLITRPARSVLMPSQPYGLPWEAAYQKPLATVMDETSHDELAREQT